MNRHFLAVSGFFVAALFSPLAHSAAALEKHVPLTVALDPTEGSYAGGDFVSITGNFVDSPYIVTLAGVEAVVLSVISTELLVRTGPLETTTCTALRGPVVVTEVMTGIQRMGPDWTYRPPALCREAPEPCDPSDATLCLLDGRFAVEVDRLDGAGQPVSARVAASSSASGAFWFFQPDSWEMHLKIVDGCALNNHFWVYAAASTHVGHAVRVTDRASDEVLEWTNSAGSVATAFTESTAFATCRTAEALALEADQSVISPDGAEILLVARVVDAEGSGVPGATVEFKSEVGMFQAATRGVVVGDVFGQAVEVLTVTAEDLEAGDRDIVISATALAADGAMLTSEIVIAVP